MSDRDTPGPGEQYCQSCGEIVNEDTDVCPSCGVTIDDAPSADGTFEVGAVLGDAVDRLGTQAGAVVIGLLTLLGVVWTVAWQDITRNVLQDISQVWSDELAQEDPEAAAELEEAIETMLEELPLAAGMGSGTASLVALLVAILSIVVVLIALDTFANDRDAIQGIETDALGWKTLNLFLGTIAMAILVTVGTVVVVGGLIIGALLVYFPAAIAIDNENFVSAFGSSASVATDNVGGTAVVFLLLLFSWIAVSILSGILGAALPAAAAAVVGDLLRTVAWVFTLAVIAQAYVTATAEPDHDVASAAGGTEEEWGPEDTGAT